LSVQETIRLTQQVKAGGCASKLPAGSLRRVLSSLPAQTNPGPLVGFDTSDDAVFIASVRAKRWYRLSTFSRRW